MERIIIINDNNCREDLSRFLKKHKDHILFHYSYDEFSHSAKDLLDRILKDNSSERKLIVPSGDQVHLIRAGDIIRIHASADRSLLFLSSGSVIETDHHANELAEKLKGSSFLRVHKDHIINGKYISSYNQKEQGSVKLKNGDIIPVEGHGIQSILEYLDTLGTEIK